MNTKHCDQNQSSAGAAAKPDKPSTCSTGSPASRRRSSSFSPKANTNISPTSKPNLSPLKRKMSDVATSNTATNASVAVESKRKRHHRRKKRQTNVVVSDKTFSVSRAKLNIKCQKLSLSKKPLNGSNPTWKRKRKFTSAVNQHVPVSGYSQRPPGGASSGGAAANSSNSHRPKPHHHNIRQKVVLRPTKVPLLNAPRNSTQFIIDDHETSDLVWTFESGVQDLPKLYDDEPVDNADVTTSVDECQVSTNEETVDIPAKSSELEARADAADEEFSERDFQAVYETAHREEVARWDRVRLIEEIGALERRHKELVKLLARVDPEVYVQRLQRDVERLTEQNLRLKEATGSEEIEPDVVAVSTAEPGNEVKTTCSSSDLPDSTNLENS